jgi:O-ureido-D-serine cyclo-ligase
MTRPRIALVTARVARPLDDDLAPLTAALEGVGAHVEIEDWDDAAVDWATFDLALLRSPWDYSRRLPDFLAWAQEVSRLTTLINPLPVVRWNTDKHYLAELIHAGVPTVPSHFIEPGEDASTGLQRFFAVHPALIDFVVKPAVSAGSRDTERYSRDDVEAATTQAHRLLDKGRAVLLQPYLDRIDDLGERSMLYYAGEFSHAVRKGALLKRGEPPLDALLRKELVSASEVNADELRVGAAALAAQPFGTLAYARVDLVRAGDGTPCVLELELSEPSMFFAFSAGAAERFAAVVLASIQQKR